MRFAVNRKGFPSGSTGNHELAGILHLLHRHRVDGGKVTMGLANLRKLLSAMLRDVKPDPEPAEPLECIGCVSWVRGGRVFVAPTFAPGRYWRPNSTKRWRMMTADGFEEVMKTEHGQFMEVDYPQVDFSVLDL